MDLSLNEKVDIIHAVSVDFEPQKEVALRFRVSKDLVSRLVCKYKAYPAVHDDMLQKQ